MVLYLFLLKQFTGRVMRAAQRLQINVALESVNTLQLVFFSMSQPHSQGPFSRSRERTLGTRLSRSEIGDKRLLRGTKILLN